MTETLTWSPVATKPDSETTVLCCRDTGEWFSGWPDPLLTARMRPNARVTGPQQAAQE